LGRYIESKKDTKDNASASTTNKKPRGSFLDAFQHKSNLSKKFELKIPIPKKKE
jgi:hypothetical protein